MSKIKFCAVIVLATALASAAYARGGGGGGGGGRGGGGGGHFGGGAHFGGGGHFGGAHFGGGGGGMRFGGAHFGGARIGGAHFGGARIGRSGVSRFAARPSFRSHRSFAVRGNVNRAASRAAARANRATTLNANRANTLGPNRKANFGPNQNANLQNRSANLRSSNVQKALNSRAMTGALQNKAALVKPNTRAQLLATAATAGWHGGRNGGNAWWRHRHGGFGWVGPLFWPFAYYDIYDYALWGYGYDPLFWDYGYDDIYAGIFYPYGYDDLAAYMPSGGGYRGAFGQASGGALGQASGQPSGTSTAVPEQLAQLCGDNSRDIAGLPIDQIQQRLQVNDAQRAALDDLANASVKAAQDIKAACPTQIPVSAPQRLAFMQQRIEAMIAAVQTVQPALQKFFDLLNDEQKTQLNALVQDQRGREAARNTDQSLAQSCGAAQPGVTDWPTAEIEARIRSTEAQRASLAALQQASAKAAELLKSSCRTAEPITPPARLEAVANRLDTMLQAIKMVRAPLDDLYAQLTDEQRAQFEAIGPARSGVSNRPADAQARVRRHHRASLGGLVRHFMSMARW
jgi:LTXXQ motif family protein